MIQIKEALILAGGKGTGLAIVLNGKSKPLIEIGGSAILKHQINLLLKENAISDLFEERSFERSLVANQKSNENIKLSNL
mgnify:FL=1